MAFAAQSDGASPAPAAQATHAGSAKAAGKGAPSNIQRESARRFFEAYANVWERNTAPDKAVAEASTSVQAPARFRIDGPLANLPEFSATFACKAGQPMDSATPVSIWR